MIKLQPWQRTVIVSASLTGEKSEVLSVQFGVTPQYIGQLRRDAGHPRPTGRPRKSKVGIAYIHNVSVSSSNRLSPVIG